MTTPDKGLEVTFLVSCGRDYPTGGYITLESGETPPLVKLGPVQVTTPQFATSTKVELPWGYTGTLMLKLNFTGGDQPGPGATISVIPSVMVDVTSPPQMIRIGQQTLAF